MKKNIAVFVSGSGSDMQSVIDACESGEINGEVKYVVAGKHGIYAIERARKHGIPYGVFDRKEYASAEEKDAAIIAELKRRNIDIVVLAGYLSIVTPELVHEYEKRMINIHPSLIPKFCGKGFYGLKVHRAVLDAGEKESGATVHYVDEGADTGEIIFQSKVPVLDGDTPESLQQRVLKTEHIILPQVVADLCKE